VHVGAMRTEETVALARHALEKAPTAWGRDPVVLRTTDRELYRYYETVSRALPDDFPVYLYNIPQCAANDLKPCVVRSLPKAAETS
jgi:4-hydroxy-tetrahydrodipicolinate synthase